MLIGLIGKPNVGKSTIFKSMTMQDVQIANYPFTTINPNEGIGFVRVEEVGYEFGVMSNPKYGFIKGKYRFVPVKIIDVAGLVPGAHKGKGLGNKFLDDLRKADILIHVLDIVGATDEEGRYIGKGNYDPSKDIFWLEEEIDWWFFEILRRNLEKEIKKIKYEKKNLLLEIYKILSGLNVDMNCIISALKKLNINEEDVSILDDEEILFLLAKEIRKIAKPIIIAANRVDIDVDLAKKNIKRLKEKYPNLIIVPTSGYAEIILKELDKEGKIKYIPGEGNFEILSNLDKKEKIALDFIENFIFKEFGSTGVQKLLDLAVFEVLKYIAVFPVANDDLTDNKGNILPDCYLLPKGSKIIDLALKIHSEIAENFVRVIDMRTKKSFGKDYELKHRDVLRIVTNK
ncbi:MAG: YchF-related putative GTPase [Nanopusillaceae archaeon]